MKMNGQRELKRIADEIDDLNTSIGVIQNYISCLRLLSSKAASGHDRTMILYNLTEEKGLENISDTLDHVSRTIRLASSKLLDHSELEVAK